MDKQEIYFIKRQIERLIKRRDSLVDEFIGACTEVNKQIKELRKELKEQKNEY